MFNCIKKNHSQETGIFGWNLNSLSLLAFSVLVSKEKVLSKLLNTAKPTTMQKVFYIYDFRLLSLQPLFPIPPFLHNLCLVRPLEIPCSVGWGTFLGLSVTSLALCAATDPPFPHISPTFFLHPNVLQAVQLHLPYTYPSQSLPQELWDQCLCSVPGTLAPLACLAVAHCTVCSLDTLWSDECSVTVRYCQGLTLLATDHCERSSRSHVTLGGTAKQTDQTVSK